MKKLKKELLSAAQSWNTSGEYDSTEFAGRFFMSDTELDAFAKKYKLTQDSKPDNFDKDKIEKACKCKIIFDCESVNQNRQFGDQEIIFNRPGPKPKLETEKAKALNISFPIEMYKMLKKHPCRSEYIQKLIRQDKSHQDSNSAGSG